MHLILCIIELSHTHCTWVTKSYEAERSLRVGIPCGSYIMYHLAPGRFSRSNLLKSSSREQAKTAFPTKTKHIRFPVTYPSAKARWATALPKAQRSRRSRSRSRSIPSLSTAAGLHLLQPQVTVASLPRDSGRRFKTGTCGSLGDLQRETASMFSARAAVSPVAVGSPSPLAMVDVGLPLRTSPCGSLGGGPAARLSARALPGARTRRPRRASALWDGTPRRSTERLHRPRERWSLLPRLLLLLTCLVEIGPPLACPPQTAHPDVHACAPAVWQKKLHTVVVLLLGFTVKTNLTI